MCQCCSCMRRRSGIRCCKVCVSTNAEGHAEMLPRGFGNGRSCECTGRLSQKGVQPRHRHVGISRTAPARSALCNRVPLLFASAAAVKPAEHHTVFQRPDPGSGSGYAQHGESPHVTGASHSSTQVLRRCLQPEAPAPCSPARNLTCLRGIFCALRLLPLYSNTMGCTWLQ